MLKEYPKLKRGVIEKFSEKLKKEEKDLLKEYMTYRKARGLASEDMTKNVRRIILQIRYILEHSYKEMTLKELRELLSIINSSKMANHYRNNVKANLKNFLKYAFPDWSMRFSNLDDIKFGEHSMNEEKINHKTLLSKEDIEKLVRAETRNYWRAFLLVQYEAGLRTKEARLLKWSDIHIDMDEDLTEINIFATKTAKARTLYVKEATHYLKLLKQEQENLKEKGVYVFPAKINKDKPVEKYAVNGWFSKLTEKVLGRKGWNYLLRHSRATELYTLAQENKISKDTAIKFMGHSEDMSKAYNHPNPEDVKKMLRDQVYNIEELPEEKKNKLEKEIEDLRKERELEDKRYKAMAIDMKRLRGIVAQLVENQKQIG